MTITDALASDRDVPNGVEHLLGKVNIFEEPILGTRRYEALQPKSDVTGSCEAQEFLTPSVQPWTTPHQGKVDLL